MSGSRLCPHIHVFLTAFPLRLGLFSTHKQICRSLKPEALENSSAGEDFQKTLLYFIVTVCRGNCFLRAAFVFVTLSPKETAGKWQAEP